MKLDFIIESWRLDSKVDNTDLGNESLRSAVLHSKYMDFLSKESIILSKLYIDKKQLNRLLLEYYTGTMPLIQVKELGWDPFLQKILRSDVKDYIESDERMSDMMLKIAHQEQKVNLLTDIVKHINNRGFAIKNAIDYLKWSMGS